MSRILLIVSLALAPLALCAQTAEDHFHRGAQFYVFGEKTNAVVEVATGLQKFPDDEKLRALAEILAKEEEQQNQQQNQKQKPEDQQKQQPEQPEAKQDQQDPQGKQDQEQQDQQAKPPGEQKDKAEPKGEPSQPLQAHAMTPQEAQQLLDAQKGEEQFLQLKPVAEKPERRQRPIKDW